MSAETQASEAYGAVTISRFRPSNFELLVNIAAIEQLEGQHMRIMRSRKENSRASKSKSHPSVVLQKSRRLNEGVGVGGPPVANTRISWKQILGGAAKENNHRVEWLDSGAGS
jgi:hypothetical protein